MKTVTRLFLTTTAAVLLVSPGCAPNRVDPKADLAERAIFAPESFAEADGSDPAAAGRSINLFGEFDGRPTWAYSPADDVNFQQHTLLDEGYDTDVALDPTGAWMVYASTRHSEHSNLYLQRTDGHTVTQLTNDRAADAFPTFSPDGKSIAFSSTRGGNWQVYAMDVDGRNVVQLTDGPTQAIHPTFSPDGTRIAYCTIGGRSNQWELWLVHLTTNERQMIGYGLFPAWAPERTVDRIAYQRAKQRSGRWFSIWTLDLVDGEARRTTEVVSGNTAAAVAPSWSPDGKKLAFTTIVAPASGKPGQQDVWTINADGTNRQRITDGNGTAVGPCWAANNRIYFVSNRSGVDCVWSARTDGRVPAVAGLADETKDTAEASNDTGDVAH